MPCGQSCLPSADACHICAAVHSGVKSKFSLCNERPAVPTTATWVEAAFISNFRACVSSAETCREFASQTLLWLHLLDKVAGDPRTIPLRAGAGGDASPSPPLTYWSWSSSSLGGSPPPASAGGLHPNSPAARTGGKTTVRGRPGGGAQPGAAPRPGTRSPPPRRGSP